MNHEKSALIEDLFKTHYANLLFYATRLVGEEDAEDIVQDVMLELWKKQDSIEFGDQIRAFLYRAVYTRCLNFLKHQKIKQEYYAVHEEIQLRRIQFYSPDNDEVIGRIENQELHEEIYQAINGLPDKCREIFLLSYLQDLKNKEIATLQGVSLRTVEAHMYKALKHLRSKLSHLSVQSDIKSKIISILYWVVLLQIK